MEFANSTSQEVYASELQGDSNSRGSGQARAGNDKPEIVFGMPGSQPFIVSANPDNDMSLGYANLSQHPAQINSFASPAFMLQNSRIVGEASMSTSFLQEATHILNLYNQECH